MGRPPTHGAPSFRFFHAEVAQMEALLREHGGHVPPRELLMSLANKFSNSQERAGKIAVQMKQVWNWFQNRRYALRSKLVKSPGNPNMPPNPRDEVGQVRNVPPVPQQTHSQSGYTVARNTSENPPMEFEAKSARDGAWYDVQLFLSHRYLETGNPEVLVRFSGFGPEEDEWVVVRKHVRQRSLPCESSECVAVLPGDLILCFQEGKEQALYFDAHVLDAQRRRHDVRGCRCRFLVRYDHDQTEEIVPLRKICRRPETDYRLQQLHAANESAPTSTSVTAESNKPAVDPNVIGTMRVTNPHPSATVPVPPPTITNVSAQTLMSAPTPAPTSAPTASPTLTSAPSPSSISNPTPSPTPISAPSPALASAPSPALTPMSFPTPSSTQVSAPSPSSTSISAPSSSSTLISASLSPTPASAPFSAPVSAPALTPISDPSRSSAPISGAAPPPALASAPSPTLAPISSLTSTLISASTLASTSAPSLSAVVAPVSTPTLAPVPTLCHIPVIAPESKRLESDDSGISVVGVSAQDKIIYSGSSGIVAEAKNEGICNEPEAFMMTESSVPLEKMSDKPTVPVPEPEKVDITAPSEPAMAVGTLTIDGGLVSTEISNPTVSDTKE